MLFAIPFLVEAAGVLAMFVHPHSLSMLMGTHLLAVYLQFQLIWVYSSFPSSTRRCDKNFIII